LSHAVTKHLAAAELALVAVHGVIALDLGDKFGVAEPHTIAGRRAEERRVMPTIDGVTHDGLSNSPPPRTLRTWPPCGEVTRAQMTARSRSRRESRGLRRSRRARPPSCPQPRTARRSPPEQPAGS